MNKEEGGERVKKIIEATAEIESLTAELERLYVEHTENFEAWMDTARDSYQQGVSAEIEGIDQILGFLKTLLPIFVTATLAALALADRITFALPIALGSFMFFAICLRLAVYYIALRDKKVIAIRDRHLDKAKENLKKMQESIDGLEEKVNRAEGKLKAIVEEVEPSLQKDE